MTRFLYSAVVATALVGPLTAARVVAEPAGRLEPVAVLALPSYNDLKGDIGYVGRISGNPDLAKGLEALLNLATQNRGLAGLDKDRPWGIVALADHEKLAQGERKPERVMVACGFLPVSDATALLEVLAPVAGQPEEIGGGVWKFAKQGKTAFLKQSGDWLFFAPRAEFLEAAPEQPVDLLAGLDQQYDAAVQLRLDGIPAASRQEALADLRRKAEADLRRKPRESDEEFAFRQIVLRGVVDAILSLAAEVDQVTLGWKLDEQSGESHLDLTVSVRPGSEAARRFAALAERTSGFHGFMTPEATLSGNWSVLLGHWDRSDLGAVFDLFRKQAAQEIDRREDSAQRREAAKQLAHGLLDVIEQTLAAGRLDGGMAVRLDPDAVTLAAGGFVADGDGLEQTLADAVEAVRAEDAAFVDRVLTTDVAQYKDLRFHKVSLPLPSKAGNRPQLVRMFGETLDVLVGIGRESFYVAAGKEARSLLEQVVKASEQQIDQTATPAELSLSLRSLAGFVAEVGKAKDRAGAEKLARLLEESTGRDHVTFVASPVERGVRLRLELEEGVLKAIGAAASKQGLKAAGATPVEPRLTAAGL